MPCKSRIAINTSKIMSAIYTRICIQVDEKVQAFSPLLHDSKKESRKNSYYILEYSK